MLPQPQCGRNFYKEKSCGKNRVQSEGFETRFLLCVELGHVLFSPGSAGFSEDVLGCSVFVSRVFGGFSRKFYDRVFHVFPRY